MDTSDSADNRSAYVQYAEEFNDESAEVTYQSSDGIRFRIHIVFLKAHSEILTPAKGSTFDEVVYLTESADTLKLLFKFIYPLRQPVLDSDVSFQDVRALAEAAEKYRVFPVMYVCYLQMRSVLPRNALYILGFALKHDYMDLVDLASSHAIDTPIPEIIDHIPFDSYKPWFMYHKKWAEAQTHALTKHAQTYNPPISDISCVAGKLSVLKLAAAKSNVTVTNTVSNRGRLNGRSIAASGENRWWKAIDTDVRAIPKLSTFISPRAGLDHAVELAQAGTHEDGVIIIESTEGDCYSIDSDVLRSCARGFGDPIENIIKVTEKGSVINLLLKFIQPVRSPDLQMLSFENLYDLTCTAEKYSIHQATGICRIFMKKHLPSHPSEVFQYAAKWNQLDILDLAAPLVLDTKTPFDEMICTIPISLVVPWARYFQKWQEIARKMIMEAISADFTQDQADNQFWNNPCCNDDSFVQSHLKNIIGQLCEGPGALKNVENLFPTNSCCSRANIRFRRCREMAKKAIEEIPKLSGMIASN